ncbi:MAG: PHP domain-containing protein, partial [Anaerolineales bacterium]|nr:PHP domain-containing protein [Anaerolineales bacterium]
MVIHLTTHSAYSLQEGLATPAELVQAAQAHGMSALGLTDHNLLTGAVEFVTACKDAGVQPILGLEIDLEQGPLQLLAMSAEGWSNLCRLSSTLALRDKPEGVCTLEMLSAYSKDLIAFGAIQLEELKNIFQDRLYISLRHPSNVGRLSDLARKLSLPAVVAHPIYYLSPEQAQLQKTLTAIRLNKTLKDIPSNAIAPADSYFMSAQEMESRFRDYPEALAATTEIAERCRFDLPFGKAHMPTVPLPPGISATEFLRQKAYA